jgi:hypothetical protein
MEFLINDPVTSSPAGTTILLSILFPTLLKVRGQVSPEYKLF